MKRLSLLLMLFLSSCKTGNLTNSINSQPDIIVSTYIDKWGNFYYFNNGASLDSLLKRDNQ